ncbi:2-hydroxychromene-2-carboxylate isomerase [Rhodovulum sp. DZ06]|uniref:2-hydroxychromene-2-carboxylate isomerase n=1 Tax=Rhodovulum sp. DZ06 TaxID=3425126 RepID=UPI003D337865
MSTPAQTGSTLTFWFEFASTYSYLSAMRIEGMARDAGVALRWRPFLLGPIFAAQGWDSSPFNIYPAKGRNMWRDMERRAAARGLPPVIRPAVFPQNGLRAARVATLGADRGWGPRFVRAVYTAEFAEGRDIGADDGAVAAEALEGLGLSPDAILAEAEAPGNKARLRAATEEAQVFGIFGAPSFTTEDGELFWGDDRLEDALGWAARLG